MKRQDWARLSQAERDAAYDNLAAAPDGAARLEALRLDSAVARAADPVGLDRPYGPAPRERVDFFPAGLRAPCLVFLHGGYWQRNAREDFAALMEGVRAHGWAAALPGYTLAPEAPLTRIVEEVHEALDLVAARIAGPLVVSGWSAGAHLAAMALGHPRVVGGLGISGVYDLGAVRDTRLNQALRLTEAEVDRLSPVRLPPVPKPFTLAYGTRELPELVESSRALFAHREVAGAPGLLLALQEHDHFSVLDELRAPNGALTLAARMLA